MADPAPDPNAAKIASITSLIDGMTKEIEKRKTAKISTVREEKMLASYKEQLSAIQTAKPSAKTTSAPTA